MIRITKLLVTLSAAMLISGAALALDGFSIGGLLGLMPVLTPTGSEIEGHRFESCWARQKQALHK